MARVLAALGALVALALIPATAPARPLPGVASGTFAQRGDARALAQVGARWTYDWSAQSGLRGGRVEFVPMLWGADSVTDDAIAGLTAARRAGTAKRLLGFNEPDLAGQANMTPEQAIALWPRLEATGLVLGSPAVATTSDGWLDRFMTLAREQGRRVDFIALHYYGDYTDPGTAAWIARDLRAVHDRWKLPIWVTEMGTLPAWTWEGRAPHATPTPALARAHLRRLTGMLGRLSFVRRWAWFMDTCDGDCASSAVLTPGGRPTALGRALRRAAR